MKLKNIALGFGLALAAAKGVEGYRSPWSDTLNPAVAFRQWLLEMHRRQVELLKISWGNPGFCTEWDLNFNPNSRKCSDGRYVYLRRVP